MSSTDECSFEQCRSRRFRTGEDGYTYCERGHQQSERGALVTADTGELQSQGRTARRRRPEDGVKDTSLLDRRDAVQQYLLHVQLFLRVHTHWLIRTKGLPKEIESMTRGLWSLRLRQITTRLQQSGLSPPVVPTRSDARPCELPLYTSDQFWKEKLPSITEVLSICYLAILLLQVPITITDLHSWADNAESPFYHFPKIVTRTTRARLHTALQKMLMIKSLDSVYRLHRSTMFLQRKLMSDFGISFPPPNYRPILYRWTTELMLPIETMAIALGLFQRVFNQTKQLQDNPHGYSLSSLPLVELMAVLVIGSKVVHGWYDKHASSTREYQHDGLRSALIGTAKSENKTAIQLSELDAADVEFGEIDLYFAWYESIMTNSNPQGLASTKSDFRLRSRLAQHLVDQHGTAATGAASAEIDFGAAATSPQMQETGRDAEGSQKCSVSQEYGQCTKHAVNDWMKEPLTRLYHQAAGLAGAKLSQLERAVGLAENSLFHAHR